MRFWKRGETFVYILLRYFEFILVLRYYKNYYVTEKTSASIYDVFEGETVIEEMLLSRNHLEIYSSGVFVEVILT